uniref:G-protein coupled receptors family 1 profile domain-containing protein n=1 Tax=Meloidogyne floridensis TaxID=298350 RepID=A0A915PBW4_9BILA
MNQNLDYMEEYGDGTFELQATILPNECSYPIGSSSYKNAANVRYLFRHGIINWPNFTHCLPNCGLCTQFASDHAYQIYNLVVIGFLLPFISLCGLCGNILSAFIYSRPALRHSYTGSIYLSALGCSDTAVILTALFLFFIDSIRRYSLNLSILYGTLSPVVYPAGMIAQTCSVYFTIVAAVDCFVQVCMPTKIKRLFSSQLFTKCLASGILAFAFIYNIPHCFESILLDCWHPNFQSQSVEVCPAPLRFHPTYMLIYYKYMYAIFLAVGPLIVLIVLNIIVIIATVFCKKGNSADNLALVNTCCLAIYFIYNFSRPFRCTFSRHFGPTTSPQKSHSSLCGHSAIMRHHTLDYTNKSRISNGSKNGQNGFVLQKCTRSQSLSAVPSTTPFIMGTSSNEYCNRRDEERDNLNEENLKVEDFRKETILEEGGENFTNRIKIKNSNKLFNNSQQQPQQNPLISSNIKSKSKVSCTVSHNQQKCIDRSSSGSSGISV